MKKGYLRHIFTRTKYEKIYLKMGFIQNTVHNKENNQKPNLIKKISGTNFMDNMIPTYNLFIFSPEQVRYVMLKA